MSDHVELEAPEKPKQWALGEKLLANWNGIYYPAKIIGRDEVDGKPVYKIHYEGWGSRYDIHVPEADTVTWKDYTEEALKAAKEELAQRKSSSKKRSYTPRRSSNSTMKTSSSLQDSDTPIRAVSVKSEQLSTKDHSPANEKDQKLEPVMPTPEKDDLDLPKEGLAMDTSEESDKGPAAKKAALKQNKLLMPSELPEILKQIMVDDLDKVTMLGQLPLLPAKYTISHILHEYCELAYASPNEKREVDVLGILRNGKIMTTAFEMISFAAILGEMLDKIFDHKLLYAEEKPLHKLLGLHYDSHRQANEWLEPFKATRFYGVVYLLRFFTKGEYLNQNLEESDQFILAKHAQDFLEFIDERITQYWEEAYDKTEQAYTKMTSWKPN